MEDKSTDLKAFSKCPKCHRIEGEKKRTGLEVQSREEETFSTITEKTENSKLLPSKF